MAQKTAYFTPGLHGTEEYAPQVFSVSPQLVPGAEGLELVPGAEGLEEETASHHVT